MTSQYLRLYMKVIGWRFHIKVPFTFWDMRAWGMWEVCLQTFNWLQTTDYVKTAYFLRGLKFLRVNNSRILRIKNFQGVVFIWTQSHREIFKSALM